MSYKDEFVDVMKEILEHGKAADAATVKVKWEQFRGDKPPLTHTIEVTYRKEETRVETILGEINPSDTPFIDRMMAKKGDEND